MKVVSMESDGGVSRISVYVQAGAKHENSSNLGITHVLRNAAYLVNVLPSFFASLMVYSFLSLHCHCYFCLNSG